MLCSPDQILKKINLIYELFVFRFTSKPKEVLIFQIASIVMIVLEMDKGFFSGAMGHHLLFVVSCCLCCLPTAVETMTRHFALRWIQLICLLNCGLNKWPRLLNKWYLSLLGIRFCFFVCRCSTSNGFFAHSGLGE